MLGRWIVKSRRYLNNTNGICVTLHVDEMAKIRLKESFSRTKKKNINVGLMEKYINHKIALNNMYIFYSVPKA